ncbi:MAG: hypothetical protein ACRD0J_08360 [Acidimicrobiales bacterium]
MTGKGVSQKADNVKWSHFMKAPLEAKQRSMSPLNATETADLARYQEIWSTNIETLRRQSITISDNGREAIVSGTGRQSGYIPGTHGMNHPLFPTMTPTWGAQFNARQVRYDRSKPEQDASAVRVAGGQLTWAQSGTPVDTSGPTWVTHFSGPGWAIYVLSPDGHLHVASHKVGAYHHSSLMAGVPVAAAGELKAAGGAVTHLSNKSGHYMPGQEHLRNMLWFLAGKSGVALGSFALTVTSAGPPQNYPTADAYMNQVTLKKSHQDDKGVESLVNDYGGMIKVAPMLANQLHWQIKRPSGADYYKAALWKLLKPDGSTPTYAEVKAALASLSLTKAGRAPLIKTT